MLPCKKIFMSYVSPYISSKINFEGHNEILVFEGKIYLNYET